MPGLQKKQKESRSGIRSEKLLAEGMSADEILAKLK